MIIKDGESIKLEYLEYEFMNFCEKLGKIKGIIKHVLNEMILIDNPFTLVCSQKSLLSKLMDV